MKQVQPLPISIEAALLPRDWSTVMTLAANHHLTAYDAASLELAHRTGLPLATLDAASRRAAQDQNVPLLGL